MTTDHPTAVASDAAGQLPEAWSSDILDPIEAWFNRAAKTHAGFRYAAGGVLHHEFGELIQARVEYCADVFGEPVRDVAPIVYQVPDAGMPWTCPVEQDPRNGHRRRVAVFVPITDALGGDLEVRHRATGQVVMQPVGPGEAYGARSADHYRFSPVDHGRQLWLVALGIAAR